MKYKVLLLALAAITTSCSPQADINYQIIPEQPQQTMDHFSASDAWSMHIIGKWPQEKQDQVADWLFSNDNDANGKPKGIGLSLWRFNVGAGRRQFITIQSSEIPPSRISSQPINVLPFAFTTFCT